MGFCSLYAYMPLCSLTSPFSAGASAARHSKYLGRKHTTFRNRTDTADCVTKHMNKLGACPAVPRMDRGSAPYGIRELDLCS